MLFTPPRSIKNKWKREKEEKKEKKLTISGCDLKQQSNSNEHQTCMEQRIPHRKNLAYDHKKLN